MELFKSYITDSNKVTKYLLNLLDITDSIPQALVRHEFIGTDGALLIPMGLKAREIKFKCFFFGDKQEEGEFVSPTYNNHFEFINFINNVTQNYTLIHLVHPKYGDVGGFVENTSIYHDDTQEYVEIELNIVEDGIKNAGELLDISSIKQALSDQLYDQLLSEKNLTNAMFQSSGLGEFIGVITDTTKKLKNQFSGITQKARNFLGQIDTVIDTLDSFYSAFNSIAITTNVASNFIADVPGRLLGGISGCLQRQINSMQDLANLPLQTVLSMDLARKNLVRTIGSLTDVSEYVYFQNRINNQAAAYGMATAGTLLQTDQNNAAIQEQTEKKPSFDVNGRRISTVATTDTLSSTELDLMAYTLRKQIQECLEIEVTTGDFPESGRDNRPLRAQAASLQDYINTVKIKKMKQTVMNVNNIPLHVLCNQLGLSYQAAERILKINSGIYNPTFVEGAIKVYTV